MLNEYGYKENSGFISKVKQINNHRYKGQIAKIIGHKDDPGVDIITEAYKHEIDVDFPPEAIDELETIPSEVAKSYILAFLSVTEISKASLYASLYFFIA